MACRLTERPTFTPSWFLSGLIAVVTKSGGAHGFADIIVKKIRSRRGAEMAIFFLGFVIFFDDYANTLILGGTMRKCDGQKNQASPLFHVGSHRQIANMARCEAKYFKKLIQREFDRQSGVEIRGLRLDLAV